MHVQALRRTAARLVLLTVVASGCGAGATTAAPTHADVSMAAVSEPPASPAGPPVSPAPSSRPTPPPAATSDPDLALLQRIDSDLSSYDEAARNAAGALASPGE